MGKGHNLKTPLLRLLSSLYPALSKDECFSHILCGDVYVNDVKNPDPKSLVEADSRVVLVTNNPFVSRGGVKLDHALKELGLDVKGLTVLDAGCSTGGFTDCLIRGGARTVFSVDVGYNQLDYSLRKNAKVRLYERTNIMNCTREFFPEPPDAAVSDLSFRSMIGAASHLLEITGGGWVLALIKPQFEWKDPAPDFNGVVRNRRDLKEILSVLSDELREEGVFILRIVKSPIQGAKGNQEFFFQLSLSKPSASFEVDKEIERMIGLIDERLP